MNRRSFLASGVSVALMQPKPRFISPTEVYVNGEWKREHKGIAGIKAGTIYRVFHPLPEYQGELHSSTPGICVALEDGHLVVGSDGNLCGGCTSNFYTTLEEAACANSVHQQD